MIDCSPIWSDDKYKAVNIIKDISIMQSFNDKPIFFSAISILTSVYLF